MNLLKRWLRVRVKSCLCKSGSFSSAVAVPVCIYQLKVVIPYTLLYSASHNCPEIINSTLATQHSFHQCSLNVHQPQQNYLSHIYFLAYPSITQLSAASELVTNLCLIRRAIQGSKGYRRICACVLLRLVEIYRNGNNERRNKVRQRKQIHYCSPELRCHFNSNFETKMITEIANTDGNNAYHSKVIEPRWRSS